MVVPDVQYGSDAHGLVWGYLFTPDSPARALDSVAAVQWLQSRQEDSTEFLWLHFSLSNASCLTWMKANLELPDIYFESLHESIGSTRLEFDANALVSVIHDVPYDRSYDPSAVSTVTLCIQPHLVVSARLRPLRSLDQLRAMVKSGDVFRSSTELLSHLLRVQADILVGIIRQHAQSVDKIEDSILANRIASQRSELGSIRRSVVRLQRLLAPEPAALFRLLNRPPRWMVDDDVLDLGKSAEEFSVAIAESASLVERAKLLQEELTSLVNERTNQILFILTLVTVFALPFTIVSGLFGMNVGGIPWKDHDSGFFWVTFFLIASTVVGAVITFKRFRN
ncbi:MAG: transporter [Candidatus Kapabacteria bacterium]|nr:transporter [Candidatus Kapabacteria bacterium]